MPADAGGGVSHDRRHPPQQAPTDGAGKYALRTAQAQAPRKAHQRIHRAALPLRGLRRAQRCQAQRDHREKSRANVRPTHTAAHGAAHPHAKRGGEAAGRAGNGTAALPPVLSALHVHRLPPGRAVRSAMVGLYRHAKRSAAHRQPLPQQRSRQGHRGGQHQKRQEP